MDTNDTVGSRVGRGIDGKDVDGAGVSGRTVGHTMVSVVRGSLLAQDVDAVVNAANTRLADGGGITRAIFEAAGAGLAEEIAEAYPQGTPTGVAVTTGGHGLRQPFIIHVPGPDCRQRQRTDHRERFIASYRSCLEVADDARLDSIAFCSISTGVFVCRLAPCATLAIRTVMAYLGAHPETSLRRVVFAMYGKAEWQAFASALSAEAPAH